MSDFMDKAKATAGDLSSKAADAVDKATDVIDDKTGGKSAPVTEKIDQAAQAAADKISDLTSSDSDDSSA